MRLRSTPDEIDTRHARLAGDATAPSHAYPDLGETLLANGLIDADGLETVRDRQADDRSSFTDAALATGLVSAEALEDLQRRQQGGMALEPGDERIDPLVRTAFNLENGYAARVRNLRSRIVQHQGAGRQGVGSCALIGLSCATELTLLAANLATLLARMGAPTLLVDEARHNGTMRDLFALDQAEGAGGLARTSALHTLYLAPDPDGDPANLPRGPVLQRMRFWSRPGSQIVASLPVESSDSAATIAEAAIGMDAAVLVVRRHVTLIEEARHVIDALDERGVTIAGTVLV